VTMVDRTSNTHGPHARTGSSKQRHGEHCLCPTFTPDRLDLSKERTSSVHTMSQMGNRIAHDTRQPEVTSEDCDDNTCTLRVEHTTHSHTLGEGRGGEWNRNGCTRCQGKPRTGVGGV
jgi:hypothetical protein